MSLRISGVKFTNLSLLRKSKGGLAKYYDEKDRTFEVLLAKIRNGLAHQGIRPKNAGKYWNRIVISNRYNFGGVNEVDVIIEFTQEQLKQMALLITDEYERKPKVKKN